METQKEGGQPEETGTGFWWRAGFLVNILAYITMPVGIGMMAGGLCDAIEHLGGHGTGAAGQAFIGGVLATATLPHFIRRLRKK